MTHVHPNKRSRTNGHATRKGGAFEHAKKELGTALYRVPPARVPLHLAHMAFKFSDIFEAPRVAHTSTRFRSASCLLGWGFLVPPVDHASAREGKRNMR